jgi:hypothetical protein
VSAYMEHLQNAPTSKQEATRGWPSLICQSTGISVPNFIITHPHFGYRLIRV